MVPEGAGYSVEVVGVAEVVFEVMLFDPAHVEVFAFRMVDRVVDDIIEKVTWQTSGKDDEWASRETEGSENNHEDDCCGQAVGHNRESHPFSVLRIRVMRSVEKKVNSPPNPTFIGVFFQLMEDESMQNVFDKRPEKPAEHESEDLNSDSNFTWIRPDQERNDRSQPKHDNVS